MNETTTRVITGKVGELVRIDPNEIDNGGKFIKFKVKVKARAPLLKDDTLSIKGSHLWIPLKYESLPLYYFHCGYMGHTIKHYRDYYRR